MADAIDGLRQRYRARLHGDDPLVAAVAREALDRLSAGIRIHGAEQHRREPGVQAARAPARWAHALMQLLTEAGNPPVRWREDGSFDCGHQPAHGSWSGACLWVHPDQGRWWCRSCLKSGDALALVMAERGCTLPTAYAVLRARFGPPFRSPTS
jgi:hypothetical protein